MNKLHKTFKVIKFTGPYGKLKTLGFEFQRLFAGNYMQWHHDESDIRIWKRGADLTINCIQNNEGDLLQWIIDKVTITGYGARSNDDDDLRFRVYKNIQTHEITLHDTEYMAEKKASMVMYTEQQLITHNIWQVEYMSAQTIYMLRELHSRGWIEIKEETGTVLVPVIEDPIHVDDLD